MELLILIVLIIIALPTLLSIGAWIVLMCFAVIGKCFFDNKKPTSLNKH